MIEVNTLNGARYYINADLIETIEMIPDTLITMTNGKKHYVLEPANVVIARIEAYKAGILSHADRLAAAGETHDVLSIRQELAKEE